MQLDVMSSSSDEMKVTEPEVTNSTVDKRKVRGKLELFPDNRNSVGSSKSYNQ